MFHFIRFTQACFVRENDFDCENKISQDNAQCETHNMQTLHLSSALRVTKNHKYLLFRISKTVWQEDMYVHNAKYAYHMQTHEWRTLANLTFVVVGFYDDDVFKFTESKLNYL